MHPSLFMLEKELIEHKIVTRLPLFLLIFGLLILGSIMFNSDSVNSMSLQFSYQGDLSADFSQGLSSFISMSAGAVSLLLSIMYLAKTFLKERQEGSLMFWRSMPVSDALTHAVKLGFALILIPLICSALVLSAELLLWFISLTNGQNLISLLGEVSFFGALLSWLLFMAKMILVSLALLPLACLLLAVSQVSNFPLLVVVVGAYTLEFLCSYVFSFTALADFIDDIMSMPLTLLTAQQPLMVFAQVGWLSCLGAYLLGGLCLLFSLLIRRQGKFAG
ncbi:hypothetical protein [Psychromonas aquimarina]|uniref:hypothetical protein n=1 Tax=Psychromonas aquimarina TaxID=444919 RepID=UPI0003F61C90|nr:hypothetical protein [Psychromonas aquimarina]